MTSRQLGLSRPTPLKNATLKRATNTNDADYPRRQVYITSSPVSLGVVSVLVNQPVVLFSVIWRFVLSATRTVVSTINCNVYRMEFSVKIVVSSHSIYSLVVNGQ